MSIAWVLLIFIAVAALTVITSIVVQHLSVSRSNAAHDSSLPHLHDQVARPQDENKRLDDTDPHGIPVPRHDGDAIREPSTAEAGSHHARTRRARAEELEAVAERERRYAERAEAEARRLRASSRRDAAGTSTEQRQRQRRAGIAPEDLDY